MILFTVFDFKSSLKNHYIESDGRVREYLVRPINVCELYGNLYLFCELGDTDIYRYFELELLHGIRTAGKVRFLCNEMEAPIPKSKIEAEYMLIGQKERATLRINKLRVGDFLRRYGGEYNVICKYADYFEVEIATDLRALRPLILSFGADIEVLTPTKLRRAVALDLKGAAIKYSEIRRLYGQK